MADHQPVRPLQWHPVSDIFPLMEGEEYVALLADIAAHGLREAIWLHPDGRIIDGRNRYRACCELGLAPALRTWDGRGSLTAFVVSLNLHRRHLNESQRAMVAAKLAKEFAQHLDNGQQVAAAVERWAREREHREIVQSDVSYEDKAARLAHLMQRRQLAAAHTAPVKTAARLMSVGERSVERARKVYEVGAPELVQAVDEGRVSVSAAAEIASELAERQVEIVARGEAEIIAAAKQIRARKTANRKAQLEEMRARPVDQPVGVYDVIVIDPPWPMEKIERDLRPDQVAFDYPTMVETELAAMHIPAAAHCHVWLWTTHKFLPVALRLLEAWRLKYVCTFVWHKPGGFQPFGLPQYNCEFALYARRGAPQFVDTRAFPTCFQAMRGRHSEKPALFYDLLRRATAGRRLDMFSRRRIEGFDAWGKEAPDG